MNKKCKTPIKMQGGGDPQNILKQLGLFGNAGDTALSMYNNISSNPLFSQQKQGQVVTVDDLKSELGLKADPHFFGLFGTRWVDKDGNKYTESQLKELAGQRSQELNDGAKSFNDALPVSKLLAGMFDIQQTGIESAEKSSKLNLNDIPLTKGSASPFGYAQKGGVVNATGYLSGSPTENNKFNIIPSNNITMQGVKYPVMAITNTGVNRLMVPNEDYRFDGADYVTEIPLKDMKADKLKSLSKYLF